MAVTIFERSRLKVADWVIVNNGTDDVQFWDLPMPEPIKPATDDILYYVDKRDTPELIAFNQYGDPRLWDIFADLNGFRLLPVEMKSSDQIRLPSRTRVDTDLRV